MQFQTVFDASHSGYSNWWFPAVGLLFVCIGALLIFAPKMMDRLLPRGPKGKLKTIFNWSFFVFALVWTLANFAITYQQHRDVVTALRDGRYSVVEGRVTDFTPMPRAGHAMERFTVNGRRFFYSDYVASPGFNNTASHGGPIREGLYVRVSYSGDLILRLEVAQ